MDSRRLWRLRKLHQFVDAELRELDATDAVEVHFFYNGDFAYALRFKSRALAVADAASRRLELERDGWTFHW
jgi:hypothetical protein